MMAENPSPNRQKVVIVNGSPRKNWITSKLLQSAREGAESAGAETEYVDLYDLEFTGCRSCLACKRTGIAEPCRCYWKDGLSPLLDRIGKADRLIAGAPIYFGEPAAGFRAFFERLVFPALSYNDYSSQFRGKIDTAVFLTMNAPREFYDRSYAAKMEDYFAPMRFLNGRTEIIPVCDTLQVKDYSKYEMRGFDAEHKKERYETEFPKMLELAYRIGRGGK